MTTVAPTGVTLLQNGARGFSRAAVEELSRLKNEPQWLLQFRLDAWDIYERTPMPAHNDEEWRRTDISKVPFASVLPYADSVTDAATAAASVAHVGRSGVVVQRDSTVRSVELTDTLIGQGVLVMDLECAVQERPDLVQRYFMTTCVTPAYSKFAALHAALWSGGTLVYVPRNVEVALPIQATLEMATSGAALFGHTLIIAEQGSSISYIDEHITAPDATLDPAQPNLALGVVEIILGDNARVRYSHLQEWAPHVYNFTIQRMVSGRDSQMNWLVASMGSQFSKANIDSVLQSQGAQTEMLGIFFGDKQQLIDHHTLQEHLVPHTTSDLLYKGVLNDESRSIYSGLIRVHEKAQRTDAYQANRNLLLSDKARADSIPNLEIGANDVRCTHGATIGQVEADQLYYLMSRGIERSVASMMIVQGFFEPVIERVPLLDLQERLRANICAKMGIAEELLDLSADD